MHTNKMGYDNIFRLAIMSFNVMSYDNVIPSNDKNIKIVILR